MQMPRMDGIEACKLIQSRQGGHGKAKIVFVTAQVSGSFETECLDAGAVGFLPKPCNILTVEECLQRAGILKH
jgi:CheY-like chemotaxis protein